MRQLTFRWPGSSSRKPIATFASAAISGVDLDSRFGMLYDAARKAADAIMRAGGRRVTQGIGHHIVFFGRRSDCCPQPTAELVALVEGARKHPQRDGIPSAPSDPN